MTTQSAIAPVLPGRLSLLSRLVPLWRHAVFLLALFAIAAAGAMIRLDVQQLRTDLDRTSSATLEARVLNDRLALEMESRRRAIAMERAATAFGLTSAATLDVVHTDTPQ